MTGRPRSFDRDEALAAAVEQFWRSGYAGTSIAMLTGAMGVTPPSLYAAFGDKERLFEEAAELYFRSTCAAVDAAAARPTAREAVATILTDTARAHTAADTPLGCMMLTEPRLAEQRAVLRERLEARIARGVEEGDLPASVVPRDLATFLVTVMRGMSGLARDGGTREDLLAAVDAALAAVPEVPVAAGRRARNP